MDRGEIADRLDEVGLLLELLGENPFKVRAYTNAARVVRGLDRDVDDLVRSGELREIRGIGPALADKISGLVRDGSFPYLDGLRAQVPPGLLAWLSIQGLGPKKARAIHVALGITTLDELEGAARAGRLRDLPGFGAASEKKILEGIARSRERAGRFLQPVARGEASRLLARIAAVPGVSRAEIAGSVRRCVETSKDLDLVVSAPDPGPVMNAFVESDGIVEVTGRGPTKCSVRLASGPDADLRVVPEGSFACALAYFTGSKAHNIALRSRAQRLGYRLNEYALARESDGVEVPCAEEADLYSALGLAWIPPELREDQGEVEAAERRELPRLLERSDLRGVLHCHSKWSDGVSSIRAMAEAAMAMGLGYLGLCDHSRSAAYAGGLSIERVREQHAEIEALNREFGARFRVLKGIEVDILPDGDLDYPDEVLESFDLVVASVHSAFGLSREAQTARMVRAVGNPFVDVLGHPTGRLLLARDPYSVDLFAVIDAAAERGVAVEINAHPSRLDLDPSALRHGIPRGMKTSVNPDAHDEAGLHDMDYGVGVARRGWCGPDDVLNAWELPRLARWLDDRRKRALAGRV